MFETSEKGTKESTGTVALIKSLIKDELEANPEATLHEVKKAIWKAHPEFNKNTVGTQVSKYFAKNDPEGAFKKVIRDLVKAGNLALVGDEAKIQQLIAIYGSNMTVAGVLDYIKEKPTGAKSLKIKDLAEYLLVDEDDVMSDDIPLQFANTTIHIRKA